MIKSIMSGVNGIISVAALLTIFSLGLIHVDWQPILLLARNVMLAGLGESTPGITINGDNDPVDVTCNKKTGICTVERK